MIIVRRSASGRQVVRGALSLSLRMVGATAPALLVAVLLGVQPAAAEPYTIVDLAATVGLSASASEYMHPAGINASGQVVGAALLPKSSYFHAFLYDSTGLHDLGSLLGIWGFSRAHDINDAGVVVGQSEAQVYNRSGSNRAFLYRDGVMRDLGTFGGFQSWASAINAAGQVVGSAELVNPYDPTLDGNYHAFLYSDGVKRDLGTLGGLESQAQAINDSGQVVGWATTPAAERHAFLWENGVMRDLGTLNGLPHSEAAAINASGQVVGSCTDHRSTVWRVFVRRRRHARSWHPGRRPLLGSRHQCFGPGDRVFHYE